MERNLHEPEIYDFRQHDRLWQRVSPGLEPYPETTAEAMPRREELPPAQEGQVLIKFMVPVFPVPMQIVSLQSWVCKVILHL